jgi:hypothetical protein
MSIATDEPEQLIIVDTCSLLDIVRSAERFKTFAGEVAAANRIRQHQSVGSGSVRIGVCDVSRTEFYDNLDKVVTGTQNALRSLRKQMLHADEVATHLGLERVATGRSEWDVQIVERAVVLAKTLLVGAVDLPTDDGDRTRAFRRTTARRAPAHRGSQATHDCIIAERAIRTASDRPPGSTHLLTSNINDFGPENGRLDAELAVEFGEVGLGFATSWSEITGRLGLAT